MPPGIKTNDETIIAPLGRYDVPRRRTRAPSVVSTSTIAFADPNDDDLVWSNHHNDDDDDDGEGGSDNDITNSLTDPFTSPISEKGFTQKSSRIPGLSEIMVSDDIYMHLLSEGKSKRNFGGAFCGAESCAKFCVGFSFVGMMFLLFIGILIETQPLYVKGVKPNQIKYVNDNIYSMPKIPKEQEESTLNLNYYKARWLDQYYTPQREESQTSNGTIIYQMQPEAKTAFKTAAFYFLTMVLSFIYSQNYELINSNLWERMKRAIHLRQYVVISYNAYRRKEYRDIPESSSRNSVCDGVSTTASVGVTMPKNEITKINTSSGNLSTYELWKMVNKDIGSKAKKK